MPWARIHDTSPRAEEWRRVFGSTRVPIVSTQPIINTLDANASAVLGDDGPRVFVLLDWEQLDPAAQMRVIAWIAEKFTLRPEEVMLDIARQGVPILMEDVDIEDPFLH